MLQYPANLDVAAQDSLLKDVEPVFSDSDNALLLKTPSREEVKSVLSKANFLPSQETLTVRPLA